MIQNDEYWMALAMEQAAIAESQNEIPVGAIVVKDNKLVASAYNQSIRTHNATAHAEIQVIQKAGDILQNYRLVGCTLYVTLEPCPMCAGALVHSRVDRVVFGASDYKTGACGSVFNLVQSEFLNHQIEIQGGVLQAACGAQISAFFKRRRAEIKSKKRALKINTNTENRNFNKK